MTDVKKMMTQATDKKILLSPNKLDTSLAATRVQ
jgi:hypothetical protein